MFVERLELVDFRSYAHARVEFGPGVHVLVGGNAQGKTNLLEALQYLAIGGSHRVSGDAPLVRAGAEAAVVRAVVRVDGGARALTVEVELRPSGRNRARVNGQPQARVRDAFGRVRSILFAPEDLQLVLGQPADRRRYLDELLVQRRPAYLAARQDYERVLRQRNALLKAGRAGAGAQTTAATLQTWTDALVSAGAVLLAARIAAVDALAGPTDDTYRWLAAPATDCGPRSRDGERVVLAYDLSTGRRVAARPGGAVPEPAALADELRAGLAAVADAERERGVTLAGPHRDELYLGIGELAAKGYASHGECWSLALALRLAGREVLRAVGEEPVVMLDDVFAALDTTRRARLAARCSAYEQVLVSAAVGEDVPLCGRRHAVAGGAVIPAPGGPAAPRS